MAGLFESLPQRGTLALILLRPGRKEPMHSVERAQVVVGTGLAGDHFISKKPDGKRQVTLFQAEFLPVLASMLNRQTVDPVLLRRNLMVRGISLNALKGRRFRVGEVLLEGTELCHPCSRMEQNLGPGGFNALRGIGGLCARVIEGGELRVMDIVAAQSG